MSLTVKPQQGNAAKTIEHQAAGAGTTALAPLTAVLSDICADSDMRDFLPYIMIPVPAQRMHMMENGKRVDLTGILVAAQGDIVSPLPAPHTITVIHARACTKEKVVVDGKDRNVKTFKDSGTPEGKAAYAAALARAEKQAPEDMYVINGKSKCKVSVGGGLLLAVLHEQSCVLGFMDLFNTQVDYWLGKQKRPGPLSFASYQKDQGIFVSTNDHNVNETKSQKGDGRYFDPRKFQQWKQVTLTADQKALITAARKEHETAINSWLSK